MKSISQKLQDDIRAIMEANIKHPNQQALDVHEPEKDEITAHDFKKLRAMKKTPAGKVHNCATHVEHAVLGKGTTVSEEHAEPDAEGNIEWYTVQFEHSTQQVLTKDLTITMSEAHMHESSEEQVDEEEKKKIVSPFDYKNYKSQIPTKPGETAGFDSKKISTGTVYSRKPVKEGSHYGNEKLANAKAGRSGTSTVRDQDGKGGVKTTTTKTPAKEAMSHQAATTMKHIPNASPALKKAAKDIKPGIAGYRDRIAMLKAGGVKEEAEIDEAYQTAKSEFVARQGRLTAAAAETEKDPARLKRMSNIPGYSAAMDLAKKTTQGAKHTKEEAIIEAHTEDDIANGGTVIYKHDGNHYMAKVSHKSGSGAGTRIHVTSRPHRPIRLNQVVSTDASDWTKYKNIKEEVEQKEYTFAEYLDAARAQYNDEDAVLVANEAFKNKDITLFIDQSQSPEA